MNVLVTGGAGFIGSHIVNVLLQDGCTVRVLDNLTSGKLENIPLTHDRLTFVKGAVEDEKIVAEVCREVDAVIHLAALVSVPESIESPDKSATTNVLGFLNVLEALRKNNFKGRLLYASSSAVYGADVGQAALLEEDAPGRLVSPYALDKYTNEQYAKLYSDLYGIDALGFRFFNVYGPRQDPGSPYSGVISIFMDRASNQQDIAIFGDGKQTRDFVFVGDVANTLWRALKSDYQGVLNLATGHSIELNELAQKIKRVCAADVTVKHLAERSGDIKYSSANLQRLEQALGFVPETGLDKGLAELKKWLDETR